jgi:peroxiredoxin
MKDVSFTIFVTTKTKPMHYLHLRLLFFFLIFNGFLFAQKNNVHIEIKLDSNEYEKIEVVEIGEKLNSILTKELDGDKKINMDFPLENPSIFRLVLDQKNFLVMLIHPREKIKIRANAKNFAKTAIIEGSPNSTLLYDTDRAIAVFSLKMDSINQVYSTVVGKEDNDSIVEVLTNQYTAFDKQRYAIIEKLIINNPQSLAGLFFIDRLPYVDYPELNENYAESLQKHHPNNIHAQKHYQRINSEKKMGIGKAAPDIILPDTSGTERKLSEFKGKVVLIDFWASWCGPCKKEIPHMKSLYNKYKPKGFEIFAVSLDKTAAAWKGYIEREQLPWVHVSDLKGWSSIGAKLYGVSSIPHLVLIDKEGKILARNIRGAELDNKFKQIFGF